MGITLAFYRIRAAQFEEIRRTRDEGSVFSLIRQRGDPFPYDLHYLELDKIYGLLSSFINPTDDPTSVLWHVFDGGVVLGSYPDATPGQSYLGVPSYLDPPIVGAISREMATIRDYEDTLSRYKTLMGFSSDTEAQEPREFPTYGDTLELFRETFCFFHIAEEAGDAIVRMYT